MLEVATPLVGEGVAALRLLAMPKDPLPRAEAIVAVGHPISYWSDAGAIDLALSAIAGALRPGGVIAIDICDLEWGRSRVGAPSFGRVGPDCAIIIEALATSSVAAEACRRVRGW
ncbi:MAG: hypothetical protein ACYDES_12585 [Acidimicrobiales bacterium]